MIYWIRDMETGRKLEGCNSYEQALTRQNKYWVEDHTDTFIDKEE